MTYYRKEVKGRNKLDVNAVAQTITQNFDAIGTDRTVSFVEVSGKTRHDLQAMSKAINDNLRIANVATSGVLTYSNVSARLKTDLQDMVDEVNDVFEQVDALDESSASSGSSASSETSSSSSSGE